MPAVLPKMYEFSPARLPTPGSCWMIPSSTTPRPKKTVSTVPIAASLLDARPAAEGRDDRDAHDAAGQGPEQQRDQVPLAEDQERQAQARQGGVRQGVAGQGSLAQHGERADDARTDPSRLAPASTTSRL